MEQKGTRPHSHTPARRANWQGVAALAVLAAMLSACTPAQRVSENTAQGFGRITGHGGGVAIMNSGEYVVIRPDGSLSARCYMCSGPREREAACQQTAARRGIEMCHPPGSHAAAPGAAQPAMLSAAGAPGGAAPVARSGGLMCPAYGPRGPLPAVRYDPGWPYWCNYQGGAAPSCTCYKMQ